MAADLEAFSLSSKSAGPAQKGQARENAVAHRLRGVAAGESPQGSLLTDHIRAR